MQTTVKRKLVFYIGFYSVESKEKPQRYSVPSAVNKMNYIAKTLSQLGYNIQIISPSWTINKNKHLYSPTKVIKNTDGVIIKHSPSLALKNKLLSVFSRSFPLFWLFLFLIKNTNKKSIVVLYHSTLLYFPIMLTKKFINFRLILEVEEIYHLFTKSSKKKEAALFSLADGYVFSSKRISSLLSDKKKPFIVINGVYDIKRGSKTKDNKFIKVVFAGNIESVRKGAFNAVRCAKHLNNKYKIYILGFGKKNDILRLVEEIEKVNVFAGYNKCNYLGVKYGNEYDQFLYNCDIAINPQEANEEYMQYAYPSKVISYLCHNLRTVSTKLQTIVDSEFSDLVTLVPNPTPKKFAEAIMSIDLKEPFDTSERIKKASFNFANDLKKLIFYTTV